MSAADTIFAVPARLAALPFVASPEGRASHIAARLAPSAGQAQSFAAWMSKQELAPADAATTELPAEFFASFLGPQLHTGGGFFDRPGTSLVQAEAAALERICAAAGLADGQEILDAGCGWGALALHIAAAYPRAHVTALTSSARQQAHVMTEAMTRGLHNVSVVRGTIADFHPDHALDRIIATDMFARIANWRAALAMMEPWLAPQGRLVVQVPVHATTPYKVTGAHPGAACWPQALMPSQSLMREFDDIFSLESEQHWRGTHVAQTARAWLANFDRNRDQARRALQTVYGARAEAWRLRWRAFFLNAAAMYEFGFGDAWGATLYVMAPRKAAPFHAGSFAYPAKSYAAPERR